MDDRPDVQVGHGKGVHLHTTGRRLRCTADPHQNRVDEDRLDAHAVQVHTDETRRTRTDGIEERLNEFLMNPHPGKRVVPLKKGEQRRTGQNQDNGGSQHDLRVQVKQVGDTQAGVVASVDPFPDHVGVSFHRHPQVHQHGIADTAQDDQQCDNHIQPAVAASQQRGRTHAVGIIREARITEGRYGMKHAEEQLVPEVQPDRAVDIQEDQYGAGQFEDRRKAEDIEQGGPQ